MLEPIIFVLAHIILGAFGRFVYTGFDAKKTFVEEPMKTALVCLATIFVGYVLWAFFGTR